MSIAPSPLEAEIETFGEPAWDVARLFPDQGRWSEEDYFDLNGNLLIEFSDGVIEVLPMPSVAHQRTAGYLYNMILAYISLHGGGEVFFPPTRVRLRSGKYREPDVVLVLAEAADRFESQFIIGADLVVEVVSDDDRRRDLEVKRLEYAQAHISEYWIVDPRDAKITVLTLDGDSYAVHGEFAPGEQATSRLLPGFAVAVAEALAAKP